MQQFVTRSKPWNCQLQVSLFTPMYSLNMSRFNGLGQTSFIKLQTTLSFHRTVLPSTRALSIELIILKRQQSKLSLNSSSLLNEKIISRKLFPEVGSTLHLVNHDVMIVSEVTVSLRGTFSRISSTRVVCTVCVLSSSHRIELSSNMLSLLPLIGFPMPNDRLL